MDILGPNPKTRPDHGQYAGRRGVLLVTTDQKVLSVTCHQNPTAQSHQMALMDRFASYLFKMFSKYRHGKGLHNIAFRWALVQVGTYQRDQHAERTG